VRIMDEAIKDGVGVGGIAYDFVPALHDANRIAVSSPDEQADGPAVLYRCPAGDSSPDISQRWSTPPPIKTKIKYTLLHRRLRVDLARPALLLFDRLVETNSEGLLEPRRTEIRVCRGAKLARLSRTALPKAGENLDLA
jgi:hypothetical protein